MSTHFHLVLLYSGLLRVFLCHITFVVVVLSFGVHSLPSCASVLCSPSCLSVSHHLRCGRPILWCPLTSMLCFCTQVSFVAFCVTSPSLWSSYPLVSTHFHLVLLYSGLLRGFLCHITFVVVVLSFGVHSLPSCASVLWSPSCLSVTSPSLWSSYPLVSTHFHLVLLYFGLLRVFLCHITFVVVVLWCPLTSILCFCTLVSFVAFCVTSPSLWSSYPLVSTHFHLVLLYSGLLCVFLCHITFVVVILSFGVHSLPSCASVLWSPSWLSVSHHLRCGRPILWCPLTSILCFYTLVSFVSFCHITFVVVVLSFGVHSLPSCVSVLWSPSWLSVSHHLRCGRPILWCPLTSILCFYTQVSFVSFCITSPSLWSSYPLVSTHFHLVLLYSGLLRVFLCHITFVVVVLSFGVHSLPCCASVLWSPSCLSVSHHLRCGRPILWCPLTSILFFYTQVSFVSFCVTSPSLWSSYPLVSTHFHLVLLYSGLVRGFLCHITFVVVVLSFGVHSLPCCASVLWSPSFLSVSHHLRCGRPILWCPLTSILCFCTLVSFVSFCVTSPSLWSSYPLVSTHFHLVLLYSGLLRVFLCHITFVVVVLSFGVLSLPSCASVLWSPSCLSVSHHLRCGRPILWCPLTSILCFCTLVSFVAFCVTSPSLWSSYPLVSTHFHVVLLYSGLLRFFLCHITFVVVVLSFGVLSLPSCASVLWSPSCLSVSHHLRCGRPILWCPLTSILCFCTLVSFVSFCVTSPSLWSSYPLVSTHFHLVLLYSGLLRVFLSHHLRCGRPILWCPLTSILCFCTLVSFVSFCVTSPSLWSSYPLVSTHFHLVLLYSGLLRVFLCHITFVVVVLSFGVHSLPSCASVLRSPSWLSVSHHLRCGRPILWCPLTSILCFCTLVSFMAFCVTSPSLGSSYPLVSTHFHLVLLYSGLLRVFLCHITFVVVVLSFGVHSLPSCASILRSPSCLSVSHHLRYGRPILWCPLTSILSFCTLVSFVAFCVTSPSLWSSYPLVSTHFHLVLLYSGLLRGFLCHITFVVVVLSFGVHSLPCCASVLRSPSWLSVSHHLRYGRPILWCPLTSILCFCTLVSFVSFCVTSPSLWSSYPLVSTHFHLVLLYFVLLRVFLCHITFVVVVLSFGVHSLPCCASVLRSPSWLSVSHHLRCGRPILWCPLTSILCFCTQVSFVAFCVTSPSLWSSDPLVSTHFHLVLLYSGLLRVFLSHHLRCGRPILWCPLTSILCFCTLVSFVSFCVTSPSLWSSFGVHSLPSCASVLWSPLWLSVSHHLRCGRPILWCPLTSILCFCTLVSFVSFCVTSPSLWSSYPLVSTHFHLVLLYSGLLRGFLYHITFVVVVLSFGVHSLPSCASILWSPSCLSVTSPSLWSSYPLVSTHFHLVFLYSGLLRGFLYHITFVVVVLSFGVHSLPSCASILRSPSCLSVSHHLRCGRPILWCPLTSILCFCTLVSFVSFCVTSPSLWSSYPLVSTHFHVVLLYSGLLRVFLCHITFVVVVLSFGVHSLPSCSSILRSPSCLSVSHHLRCGRPILWCPLTSILCFCTLVSFVAFCVTSPSLWSSYPLVSTHFHVVLLYSGLLRFFLCHITFVVVVLSFGVLSLPSCASVLWSPSCLSVSHHLRCGRPILWCPLTSILCFCTLVSFVSFCVTSPSLWSSYPLVSTHFHLVLLYSGLLRVFLSHHLRCGRPILWCPLTSILCFCTLVSFVSFCVTSPSLWSSYPLVSTHFHLVLLYSGLLRVFLCHITFVVVVLSFGVHSLPSCASVLRSPSWLSVSHHLRCGRPILWCPLTSILCFCTLVSFMAFCVTSPSLGSSYPLVSTHFHLVLLYSGLLRVFLCHITFVVVVLSFGVHSLPSCASILRSPSCLSVSHHLRYGRPILWCPLTSILSFCTLVSFVAFCVTSPSLWSSYPLVSTHFHLVLLYSGLLRDFLCHITFVVVVLSFGVHSLPCCASVLRSPSWLSVSHHLRYGRPILWCPLTSILCFCTLVSFVSFCVTSPSLWSSYPLVSTHFHLVLLYFVLLRVFLCHITFVVVVLSFGVHSLPCCASVLRSPSWLSVSHHLRCGRPILWCPLTSILCFCTQVSFVAFCVTSPSLWSSYPLVSTHFHLVLLYSGLLRVFLSHHLRCGRPILWCPLTSILCFCTLVSFVSFCVTSPSLWSSFGVHSLPSCASVLWSPLWLSVSHHLRCGRPILWCPLASILCFCTLVAFVAFCVTSPSLWSSYPLVSTHFHLVLLYSGLLRVFLCHITFVVVVLSFGVHSLPTCASVLWSPLWLSVSHHLRCGRPILWCPLTSILCFCTLVVSHHLRCGHPILWCPLTSILCGFLCHITFVVVVLSFGVHSLPSCASILRSPSCLSVSHHLRCGRPILWCPLTSILCFYTQVSFVSFCVTSPSLWSSYPLVSTHFHLVLLYSGLLRVFLCHITLVVVILSFGVHSLPTCASVLWSPSCLSVTSPSLWSSYPLVSTHFHLVLLYSGLLCVFLCHITFVVVILSFGVHSLPSCASVLWSPSWLSVSHHLRCGRPNLWCPLTSILCFYTLVSFVSFCHITFVVVILSFGVHSLPSCASVLWSPSWLSVSHHLRCGRPILWCPLTSMYRSTRWKSMLCFCTQVFFVAFCVTSPSLWSSYPLVSTHFHLVLLYSVVVVLSFGVSFVAFCVTSPSLWSSYPLVSTHFHLVLLYSGLLRVFLSHHLRCGRPILWCPLTSILCFCTLVSFMSFCVTSPSLWSSFGVHSLPSCASVLWSPLWLSVSHHLRCGRPILWCPLTSILCFCTLVAFVAFCVTSPSLWSSYPLVSTHFHLVLLYSGLLRVFLCHITFVVVVLSFGVHSLPSCASILRSPSCLSVSHHLRCGRPILWCPLTSILCFCTLVSFVSFCVTSPSLWSSYPLVSTHFQLVLLYSGLLRVFLCHITFVVVVLSFGVHSLPSCASILWSPLCLSVSHHLRCGHPILWCPLTSILCFCTLVSFVAFCITSPSLWSSYPLVSTHFHLVLLYSGLLRVFLYHITFVVVVLSFGVHSLPSCASVLWSPSCLSVSHHLRCGRPILWCPLTSMLCFCTLVSFVSFCVTSPLLWSSYPLVSSHFHLVLLYSGLLRGFLCHITFVVVVLSFGVHSLPCCASVLWSSSCLSVSHHLRCGRPILWCPLTSILCFCTLVSFVSFCVTSPSLWSSYPLVSTHFHVVLLYSGLLRGFLCHITFVVVVLSFGVHSLPTCDTESHKGDQSHFHLVLLVLRSPSWLSVSHHLRCGRPILWCPLTHFHLVSFCVTILVLLVLWSSSWLSVSHHLRCGRPILWCPLTSILCFCTLVSFVSFCVTSPSLWSSYPLVSTHFHLVLLYSGLLCVFLCHITFVVVVLSFGVHSLPSCASVLWSPSCLSVSHHPRCGHPILWCPLTSNLCFCTLVSFVSFCHITFVVVVLSFGVLSLPSCASVLWSPLCLSVSHHLRCGHPILWCPLTSILCFCTLVSFVAFCITSPSLWSSYPLVSTHFHLVLLYFGLLRVFLCHITFVVVVLSFGVHSLPSCVSVLLRSPSWLSVSLYHLRCGRPILWCPLTSILCFYTQVSLVSFCITSPSLWSSYPLVSTHFHLVLLYSGLLRGFLCHITLVVVILSFGVHSLPTCASILRSPSCLSVSHHLRCGRPILWCPLTSILCFCTLVSFVSFCVTSPSLWSSYPLVSTHFHVVLLYSGLLRVFLCHITFVVVVLSFGVLSLPSCASILRSPSCLSVSHHLRCGRPILWCPLTSMLCFCTLVFFVSFCVTSPSLWSSYPLVSSHFHLVLLYSGLVRVFLCHITFVVVVLSFGVHSLPSCASVLRSPSWLSVSHHLRCGRPILWCPLTSNLCFCTLVSFVAFCVTSPSLWSSYPLVSSHFHLVLLYFGRLCGFLYHITFVVVVLSFGVHSLPSCASILRSPSCLSVSHHLRCGRPILWCPLTSILCFCTLVSFVSFCVTSPSLWSSYPLVSTHFHLVLLYSGLLRGFLYHITFVVVVLSFGVHSLPCCASVLWSPSFLSVSHHLRCGRPILWCPLTSILCFCTLVSFVSFCVTSPSLWSSYPLVSTHFHLVLLYSGLLRVFLCHITFVVVVLSFGVHSLPCCASVLWSPSCLSVSHHLCCGRPILWCPLTSILCFYTQVSFVSFCVTSPSLWSSYPLVSTHFHVVLLYSGLLRVFLCHITFVVVVLSFGVLSLPSGASVLWSRSWLSVSHHLCCGRPILWCPLTSILCFYTQVSFVSFCVTSPSLWSCYPLVSTHFHVVLLYSGLLRVFLCHITFVVVVLSFGVHSLPSCASVLRSPSWLSVSHHLRCGRPILWCPLTSNLCFCTLVSFVAFCVTSPSLWSSYPLVSSHFHLVLLYFGCLCGFLCHITFVVVVLSFGVHSLPSCASILRSPSCLSVSHHLRCGRPILWCPLTSILCFYTQVSFVSFCVTSPSLWSSYPLVSTHFHLVLLYSGLLRVFLCHITLVVVILSFGVHSLPTCASVLWSPSCLSVTSPSLWSSYPLVSTHFHVVLLYSGLLRFFLCHITFVVVVLSFGVLSLPSCASVLWSPSCLSVSHHLRCGRPILWCPLTSILCFCTLVSFVSFCVTSPSLWSSYPLVSTHFHVVLLYSGLLRVFLCHITFVVVVLSFGVLSLPSCASILRSPSCLSVSHHLRCGRPILWCPLTSMLCFCTLVSFVSFCVTSPSLWSSYPLVSSHFHLVLLYSGKATNETRVQKHQMEVRGHQRIGRPQRR